MKPAVLLLPGDGGADTSLVVLGRRGAGGARRVRLALGPRRGARRGRGPPAKDAELKVELAGDLLCLEYRET